MKKYYFKNDKKYYTLEETKILYRDYLSEVEEESIQDGFFIDPLPYFIFLESEFIEKNE